MGREKDDARKQEQPPLDGRMLVWRAPHLDRAGWQGREHEAAAALHRTRVVPPGVSPERLRPFLLERQAPPGQQQQRTPVEDEVELAGEVAELRRTAAALAQTVAKLQAELRLLRQLLKAAEDPPERVPPDAPTSKHGRPQRHGHHPPAADRRVSVRRIIIDA